MFCKSCGFGNSEGAQFCQNCGKPLDNMQQPVNPQPTMPQQSVQSQPTIVQQPVQPQPTMVQQPVQPQPTVNSTRVDNAQMYAIFGIVIPVAAFLISWFIGIGLIWSIILAGLGFESSRRGESYNKTLSLIGKILNVIYGVLSVVVFILIVVGIVAKANSAI